MGTNWELGISNFVTSWDPIRWQPTWGTITRWQCLLKIRTAQVQEQLGLGDCEQAVETLTHWSQCVSDAGGHLAAALDVYASAFSTTLINPHTLNHH